MRVLYIINLFYGLAGFTQSDINGYLVTNNKDTLVGWLRYREYAQVLSYRSPVPNAKIAFYSSGQIKSFVANNVEYVRASLLRSYKIIDTHGQRRTVYRRREKDSVFLEVLVKGPLLSLYRFYDHIKGKDRLLFHVSEHCMPTDKEEMVYKEIELSFCIDYLEILGRAFGFSDEQVSILKYFKSEDPNDLIELVEYLNGRISKRIEQCFEPDNRSWFVSISAGYALLRTPTGAGPHSSFTGTYQAVGAGVDLWSGVYPGNVIFRVEGNIHKYNFKPLCYNGVSAEISCWFPLNRMERIQFSPGLSLVGDYNHFSGKNGNTMKSMFNEVRKTSISMAVKDRIIFDRRWEIGCGSLVVNTMTTDPFLVNPYKHFLFTAYHLKRMKPVRKNQDQL